MPIKLNLWQWAGVVGAAGLAGWLIFHSIYVPANPSNNQTANTATDQKLCSTDDYQTEFVKFPQEWRNLFDLTDTEMWRPGGTGLPSQFIQLDSNSYVKLGRAIAWQWCNANSFFSDQALRNGVNYNLIKNINSPFCTLWGSSADNNQPYTLLYNDLDVPGNTQAKVYSALNTLSGLSCLESLSTSGALNKVFPAVGFPYSEPISSYNYALDLAAINQLPHLIHLNISGSSIKNLSPLTKLDNLEYLYMVGTTIDQVSQFNLFPNSPESQLTSFLATMTKLKLLDLSETKAGYLTFLSKLVNLRSLSVAKTRTQTLDGIQDMKKLKRLDVSNTSISTITQVQDLTKLQYLNISHTNVRSLIPLTKLSALQELDLSYLDKAFTQDIFVNNLNVLIELSSLKKLNLIGAVLDKANCQEIIRNLPKKVEVSCS